MGKILLPSQESDKHKDRRERQKKQVVGVSKAADGKRGRVKAAANTAEEKLAEICLNMYWRAMPCTRETMSKR